MSPFVAFAQEVPSTAAKQAIIIDYETGDVLLSKNADQQMPTSSMSKVISMLVVFDALDAGHLKLDDTFKVSEKAWRKGGSKMFVEVNKDVKVEDLIRGVIVQSGNDATIVLAEGIAGSEQAFVDLVNQKAQEIGMTSSQFQNASGWPDPEHYSTAKDLALLAKTLIAEYPKHYKYYGEKEFEFNDISQPNRNPLLYRGLGADGIKTGHTEAGGYGLIGSGQQQGRRVILVINGLESSKARASESAKLLDWALKGYKNVQAVSEGQEVGTAQVSMGKSDSVPLIVAQPLKLTVPKFSTKKIDAKIEYDGPLMAPITKGEQVGTLTIERPSGETIHRPLLAGADVEALGFFAKTIAKAKLFMKGTQE